MRVASAKGSPPAYVSIHLFGSNYVKNATPGTPPDYSLDEFATAIEAEGSDRIGYISDDFEQWTAGYFTRLNEDWIDRGFYFGIEPSGSDSLAAGSAPNGPARIQYDGVESNPTLTISNNGQTWELTTDEGTDNATWSDVSASTPYKALKWGLLLGNTTGADGINEEPNWTADINPFYGSAFDDAYSESIADGTFVLSGSPPATTEPVFDQLRRKELEIDYGLTTALSNGLSSNYSKVFFNPSWSAENATVETFLKTQSVHSWVGCMGYYVGFNPTDDIDLLIDAANPISSIDPWQINMGIGLGATPQPSTSYFKGVPAEYDALTTTEKEHRIRLAAAGLSCAAAGAYVPIILTFSGLDSELWSPTEIVWLINELKTQGARIISPDQAAALAGG